MQVRDMAPGGRLIKDRDTHTCGADTRGEGRGPQAPLGIQGRGDRKAVRFRPRLPPLHLPTVRKL